MIENVPIPRNGSFYIIPIKIFDNQNASQCPFQHSLEQFLKQTRNVPVLRKHYNRKTYNNLVFHPAQCLWHIIYFFQTQKNIYYSFFHLGQRESFIHIIIRLRQYYFATIYLSSIEFYLHVSSCLFYKQLYYTVYSHKSQKVSLLYVFFLSGNSVFSVVLWQKFRHIHFTYTCTLLEIFASCVCYKM